MKSNVILFVVNAPEFFMSHRLPIAIAAKTYGYDVHVACANGPEVEDIKAQGLKYHCIPFARSGQNVFLEFYTLLCLVKLFWRVKPELIHLITIKPIIYGGIAARLTRVKSVVSAVSGLGTVFMANSNLARIRRWLVLKLYLAAFNQQRLRVIFQNPDDRDVLLGHNILKENHVRLIRGSGVNLADYPFLSEPNNQPVVVMAARLLKDKGVLEFVDAAKLLRQWGNDIDMRLIGSPDPGNPTTVSQQTIDQWVSEGLITLMGYRKDIASQYAAANIVCLPSYREGLPKSLVEAAACGRAVVTTDVPGCRDAIIPDVTGLLVPVKDSDALARAIQQLLESTTQRHAMGEAGRLLAEECFAIEKIVDQHLNIYKELIH